MVTDNTNHGFTYTASVRYAAGALKMVGVDSSRKSIASTLNRYRISSPYHGVNIDHVVHQIPEEAPVFTPNTKLAEEFDEVAPKSGEHVIRKTYPSSFAKTDLHNIQSLIRELCR